MWKLKSRHTFAPACQIANLYSKALQKQQGIAHGAARRYAPADGSSIKKSRRIYVRPRTGPQSAHLWWPAVAKLQPASVPMSRQLRHGTDRRTDHAIPKWPLRRGIITVGYRTVAAVELTCNFCATVTIHVLQLERLCHMRDHYTRTKVSQLGQLSLASLWGRLIEYQLRLG